jgi:hypothetical protein
VLVVAVVAFVYRFNTLGGSIGGFDNDHFIYLIRTDALLVGEQPLRDFADSELRGAWPALTYAVSAWAQRIGGRTLLSEAYLTVGLIALAHAIVLLLAWRLSGRWWVALLAAGAAIATVPKLYNYPKVLTLALGAWAVQAAVASPSVPRLAAVALVTVVAALFRHDLALYVGGALVAALVARDVPRWSMILRNGATYAAIVAAGLLPSLVWIQTYQGLRSYWQDARASVAVERARTELRLPAFDWSAPLGYQNLELLTYYAFWAVVAVAGVVLVVRLCRPGTQPLAPADRAMAIALVVMTALVNMSFLRANLAERFGDAAVAVVLLAAWTAAAASAFGSAAARRLMIAVPAVLLIGVLGAFYVLADAARELDTSGLSDSWGKIGRRYAAVRRDLGHLPPVQWSGDETESMLTAARYVAACTAPNDRVLVVGALHEVAVLARRRFAAGQAMFKLSLYTSVADQERAVRRLEQQSVPMIIAEHDDFEEGFVSDYPLVASYVADHYRVAGTIAVDEEPRIRVLVESNRQAAHTDPQLGLPCFQ